MRNTSDRTCRENQNTYFIFNNFFFFRKSYRLCDNVEKCGRARQATDDNIIRSMRFACWINKATNKHSEYVIPIDFPPQQWLRERSVVLNVIRTLPVLFRFDVTVTEMIRDDRSSLPVKCRRPLDTPCVCVRNRLC